MAEDDLRQAGWQIDCGPRKRVDAEFDGPGGRVWLSLGPGMEELSAWMKAVAGFDIRIEVERQTDGLVIRVDRGDNQPAWWTGQSAPEVVMRIDRAAKTVLVTARGPARESEVLLARTDL